MGTEQSRSGFESVQPQRNRWVSGTISGLVAGALFGIILQDVGMMSTIGSLYGVETALVGWIAHLVHSVVFGLVFVALMRWEPLEKYDGRLVPMILLGIVYGVVLWMLAASIVLPAWLGVVTGTAATIPTLSGTSLAGHLVFGIVLGGVYPFLSGTVEVLPRRGEQTT